MIPQPHIHHMLQSLDNIFCSVTYICYYAGIYKEFIDTL